MKIEIVIDEKNFDEQIGNVIKAKVKQVLRSSKQLNTLIEEIINSEIQKRVQILSIFINKEDILNEVTKKIELTNINGQVIREVENQVRHLLQSDIGKKNVKKIKEVYNLEL